MALKKIDMIYEAEAEENPIERLRKEFEPKGIRVCPISAISGKGIRELLSVMPALKEKYPDIRLCLGGVFEDPQLKEKVEALSDCVEWIGWVGGEEKERYLRECDIFVLPSYFEGQPVSVLEPWRIPVRWSPRGQGEFRK